MTQHSKEELVWETVLQAFDERLLIWLGVQKGDEGWSWQALDDDGAFIAEQAGFEDASSAQSAAVAWWREQAEGAY